MFTAVSHFKTRVYLSCLWINNNKSWRVVAVVGRGGGVGVGQPADELLWLQGIKKWMLSKRSPPRVPFCCFNPSLVNIIWLFFFFCKDSRFPAHQTDWTNVQLGDASGVTVNKAEPILTSNPCPLFLSPDRSVHGPTPSHRGECQLSLASFLTKVHT